LNEQTAWDALLKARGDAEIFLSIGQDGFQLRIALKAAGHLAHGVGEALAWGKIPFHQLFVSLTAERLPALNKAIST